MNDPIFSRPYPRSLSLGKASVDIRPMTATNAGAFGLFIQNMPEHDLLFVRRDIRHPKVIAAWMDALEHKRFVSLAAWEDGEMVGCGAIVTDPLSWSPQVGELRVLIAPHWRGRGLGRALIQECFAIALGFGLEKLTVQMTVDQVAAIALFEELGFSAEAVLRNHVKDREGNVHDMALLSHDVAEVQARMQTYGIQQALER
ncbi:GNAT family N-acetyltransferase [Variovorax sp. dw_954]|uniref:GNAT family N-acetyltransferase n=1 Tax=Variovorax sp. dw_954 TaxID=2720078 RepID=UPI001BD5F483|nr:GNAT family N-acetyltransferase [Variovorax sp. dw_954]